MYVCMYVGVHRRHPFSVWTTFFHSPEGAPQSNAWISAADCPARANRWECAFLPSTNCSVPEAVAHCDPRYGDCNAYTNTWMSALLTAANLSGQFESPQHDRIMQHGQQPADERQQVSSQQEPTDPCTLTCPSGARLWHRSLTCPPSALAAALQTYRPTTTS